MQPRYGACISALSEAEPAQLHKKNLLALGEDRYLTTLILKHFPNYKTKFTADAQAMTVAPDRWSILLSQRRRWINSTVHNLAELMFLPDMCGFCCFGMRFIVVIGASSPPPRPDHAHDWQTSLERSFSRRRSCTSSTSSSASRPEAARSLSFRSSCSELCVHIAPIPSLTSAGLRFPNLHLPTQASVAVHRLAHHLYRTYL